MNKNRRDFLKNACAPVLITVLGIPVLNSCSKDDSGSSNNNLNGSLQNKPISVTINLDEDEFSSLKDVGGWYNYTAKDILLVRISESGIRAFNNACPHQGARNQWSYDNNTFTCSNHGNDFPNSCEGSLICYKATINGNILTITN
ncbi:MAG: Rieske 2Fe-2S domain-containing protein [Flavobacteriaceae bacterium]|nr:Rieske 2Fe-2S domain-containing protein [Flavobacteriaceae bacterium]